MAKGGMPSGVGRGAMDAATRLFTSSGPARRATFKQLASALSTGGRGIRSGIVQRGIASSISAGTQALRGADASLAPNLDAAIRGRVLNRIARSSMATTAAVAPGYAQEMIGKAPAAIFGGAEAQNAGYRVAAQGQESALNAAAIRAQGISNAVQAGASGIGTAAGTAAESGWFKKYFGGNGNG